MMMMAAMVQIDMSAHQEEKDKGKEPEQQPVTGNELEDSEQEISSKLPAGQDSGSQSLAELGSGGGAGRTSQPSESGGRSQVAGKPRALIRAELKKSGASSFGSLAE